MILGGRVRVNGEVRTKMPVMIEPEKDIVTVDDEEIGGVVAQENETRKEQSKVYFLLNKPKGILVTNSDPANRKTVGELMVGIKERVFPVGRLDMDSRGALIMTNDGELANRLTHPRYGIEKTYIAEVEGKLGHDDIEKLKRGMWLGPERPGGMGAMKTDRFRVKLIGRERGRTILELKITETKNREIRRVMARLGHNVKDLNRVAIAGKVTIKGVDVGEHRPLSESEVKWLFHASSPDFHNEQKAATQSWYEQKEMEKERKRLEKDEPEEVEPRQAPKPMTHEPKARTSAERRETRERPVRKGRKPFIPPTGRNAGKPIGGNYIGRQRLQRETQDLDIPDPITQDIGDLPRHPLGDDATSDD
jgi:23S rRNA pseudouridine2605 synthase